MSHDIDTRQPPRRGYSLPFVLLILILLSVSLATLLFVLLSGARSTESMLGRRRLFYACDGISRIGAVAAQEYFAQTATPTSEELRAFVCAKGGDCPEDGDLLPTFLSQTPGHRVTEFSLSQVNARVVGPLDSGPFEGMIAMQDSVDMKVVAEKLSSGWKCDVTQQISLAKISMFQFFIFSDQPYTDWVPGPIMAGDGRVHANGTLCFHSLNAVGSGANNAGLWVSRVTASGRLSPGENIPTGCRSKSFSDGARGSGPRIATVDDPVFDINPGSGAAVEPQVADFAPFTTRSTNTSTWLSDSSVFNGRLQDEAHRVVPLRLPVLGSPAVQRGADADTSAMDNTTTRLLVDPMRVDGTDAADVRNQRFAFKADLRIINGVWYLRDPADPNVLGTPIWSDHAGTVSTGTTEPAIVTGSKGVGQQNIFGAAARPQRYSYYRFDNARKLSTTSVTTPTAVVSYGTLMRDPGTGATPKPLWRPGYYCGTTLNGVETACSAQTFGERLLSGTRSGFRDGHAQKVFGTGSNRAKANILPMNFDVGALQNALADCSGTELGSHFPGTCSGVPPDGSTAGPRRFNGIVYITNSWPGSQQSTPGSIPAQGSRGTALSGRQQGGLPRALCSSNADPIVNVGDTAVNISFAPCSSYEGSTIPDDNSLRGATANAVRIINSRNLNEEHSSAVGRPALTLPGMLNNGPGQTGLTIATNLPIYVLGDANVSSIPGSAPWVPFLVAGDVLSILSNAWRDDSAPWDSSLNVARLGTTTMTNIEILAGWTPTTSTAYSGGLHNFPRFLENWQNTPLNIRGSLVVGWSAVYARWPAFCCDVASYNPPTRVWGFDTNLNNILNQPPGAPLFDVQATRRWKR